MAGTTSTTKDDTTATDKAQTDANLKAADPADQTVGDDQVAENATPTEIFQPAGPTQHVVTDTAGVDRVIPVANDDGWRPAPVDPSEEDVARAEKREARLEAEAEARKAGKIDPVSGELVIDEKKS
jgi:hypothetical protein